MVVDGAQRSMPFQFAAENIPLVMLDGHVNGEGPFRFILDTGNAASAVLLSNSVAARLNLEFASEPVPDDLFKVGTSHAMDYGKMALDELVLGPYRYSNLDGMATSAIDHLSEQIGAPIHGNIGFPLLRDHAVTIDYGAMEFRIEPSNPDAGGVPFRLGSDPLIIIDACVNGRLLPFVVDTGAGISILSTAAAANLGLPDGEPTPMLGAGGADEGRLTTLDALSVGEHEQREVSVVASGFLPGLSAALSEPVEGIVGFNFLKNYAVTIDYPALLLRLRPL